MIKKITLALATAGIVSIPVYADTTEDLINALTTKGVLTEEEAKLLSKTNDKKIKNTAKVKNGPGLKIESADGKNSIKLSGRVQLDTRSFDHDNDADTFDIRRAYLGVSGKVGQYYEYKLETHLTPLGQKTYTLVRYLNDLSLKLSLSIKYCCLFGACFIFFFNSSINSFVGYIG